MIHLLSKFTYHYVVLT